MKNWRTIPKTNGLYEASECGSIRRKVGYVKNSVNNGLRKVGGKELSQKTKSNGYKEVGLYLEPQKGKMFYVHRLVYSTFVSEIPKGLAINHKDCNKANNHITNLEIVTYSENTIHAYENNKMSLNRSKGEAHCNSRMTKKEVLLYRKLHSMGVTPTQISNYYNVNKSSLCKALYRNTWKHI